MKKSDYKIIREVVEQVYGVEDISIISRKKTAVNARFLYFKLCKMYIKKYFTLKACGIEVGRDHATVRHGIIQFNQNIDNNSSIEQRNYHECIALLDSSMPVKINVRNVEIFNLITRLETLIKEVKDSVINELEEIEVDYTTIDPNEPKYFFTN
jgi:hypothetical protein